MARFKADQADNYKPVGSGSFFSLQNDKDFETVRFMYNTMDDVEAFSVHEIQVGDQTYWVNCLREYDQPVDDCPLCASGNKIQVKLWVPLYIENTGEVKIWERGRTFIAQLTSASRRFNPLCATTFDIERNGKKGDQNTTYALINVPGEPKTLEELPELPNIVGTVVREFTFEQLEEYLQTGKIAELANNNNNSQTRNPAADRRPASNAGDAVVTRRAQARTRSTNDGQPRTDAF